MNILDLCVVDVERSKAEQAVAAERANTTFLTELGRLIAANVPEEVAKEQAAQARDAYIARNRPYTWYNFDPAVIFPAIITYIQEVRLRIGDLFVLSDSQLINHAMNGDSLARFVVSARQNAAEILSVEAEDWALALIPRDQVAAGDVQRRALALYIAERTFKEMLHQAVNGVPIGVYISKDEDWRR